MLHLLILIAVIGVALYLLNKFVPMHEAFKTVINVIAVFALIIYLLHYFRIV